MEIALLSVYVETHGCKLNQADSQAIKNTFKTSGYSISANPKTSNIYVLNTCTITSQADQKARQTLRSVRRANTNSFIVVTGCYAERDPKSISNLAEADLVLGNKNKKDLVSIITEKFEGFESESLEQTNDEHIPKSKTRAMVKIQEGCDQVCSYCIVPKVRGRERSIPSEIILNQILTLEKEGFNEVVLTGTQLISYGFEYDNVDLNHLLEIILSKSKIPRIRVSSLQPQIIDQQFLNLWENERLCPHFHIPLQSGSDRVLKTMKRRYNAANYKETVNLIHSTLPQASITTDVIVGFPGESQSDFEETYNLCENLKFSDMHVFPYSTRPGTSAWYFKHTINQNIKKDRVKSLIDLSNKNAAAHRQSLLGQTREVLWEKTIRLNNTIHWSGLTDNYVRVYAKSSHDQSNKIRPTILTSVLNNQLFGTLEES